MSCSELQEEEIEVLQSIYDGDECFNQVNPTTYQYKIGDDGAPKSFLVEIRWGEGYPDELPTVNLELFYNKHIVEEVKESVKSKLLEEAEPFIGCAMTYTLFEFAKENATELTANQPEAIQITQEREVKEVTEEVVGKTKQKKEQLTKAQKKKLYSRVDLITGEMPRGHDWVDVVKHLSQSGGKMF